MQMVKAANHPGKNETAPMRRRRRPISILALLAPVLLSGSCRQESSGKESASRPRFPTANVLLISVDTLRADRMSSYGHPRQTTPFLDSRADDWVIFDSFHHSGGGTLPSHLTMITSLFPRTHNIHPGNQRALESERVTLAEQLRENGFVTAAFTDSGWMRRKFGFDQGFEVFDDSGGGFEAIVPKALQWVEDHQEDQFFLFLHTYDVHSNPTTEIPYACPDGSQNLYLDTDLSQFRSCSDGVCGAQRLAWINNQLRDSEALLTDYMSTDEIGIVSSLYDGCINYADQQIETILSRLEELAILEETLILITSDHGEGFAEHGYLLHDSGGYEEYSHLPLMIRFPRRTHGGQRVAELATMVDLMPTVLAALDIDSNPEIQGVSLMPAIEAGRAVRKDLHMYGVLRTDRWKYFSETRELYDLGSDPTESQNVYASHPETAAEMERRVRQLADIDIRLEEAFAAAVTGGEDQIELTEEELENLRALGYLQ